MPVIPCPNCRERMSVDTADVGERVVCPSCDHRFTARDAARDTGRRPARSRDDDAFDRPQKKSNKLLYIILALVGLFVVLPCVGCVGFLVYVSKAKESFTGPWTDQSVTSLEGGTAPVTASFPMTAVSGGLTDSANSGSGATLHFSNLDHNDSVKDAIFLIGYIEYPAGTANPLDRFYLGLRKQITDDYLYNPVIMPKVASELPTTLGGYPAKEARFAKDDGDYTMRIAHVNDRPKGSPARLVVILAGGTGMRDEDKQRFLNSVKIGKGK